MSQPGHEKESYSEYVEKFKQKHTKDDTFTPPEVFGAVHQWVMQQYGYREIVRPFWPGKDYTTETYPDGCLVLDNPPFSIGTKICRWYLDNGIDFFLFCAGTSAFSFLRIPGVNVVVTYAIVTFENGAKLPISFVTNLPGPRILIAASLKDRLDELKPRGKQQKTVRYPDNILTSGGLGAVLRTHQDVAIDSAEYVERLNGYHPFGGAAVISEEDGRRIAELKEMGGGSRGPPDVDVILTYQGPSLRGGGGNGLCKL